MGFVREETGLLFPCCVETYCRRGNRTWCALQKRWASDTVPSYHPCGPSLHGHYEPLCPISAEATKSKGRNCICQLKCALFKQLFSETPPKTSCTSLANTAYVANTTYKEDYF